MCIKTNKVSDLIKPTNQGFSREEEVFDHEKSGIIAEDSGWQRGAGGVGHGGTEVQEIEWGFLRCHVPQLLLQHRQLRHEAALWCRLVLQTRVRQQEDKRDAAQEDRTRPNSL